MPPCSQTLPKATYCKTWNTIRIVFHENILHRLNGQRDEVWYVLFSRLGEYLASATIKETVIICRFQDLRTGYSHRHDACTLQLECQSQTNSTFCLVLMTVLSNIGVPERTRGTRIFEDHSKEVRACVCCYVPRSYK